MDIKLSKKKSAILSILCVSVDRHIALNQSAASMTL